MKKRNDSSSFRINIGAPSIILILVVVALTVFALLSIRASLNELKLANASRDSAVEYYTADSAGEALRAELEEIIRDSGGDTAALESRLLATEGVTAVDMERGYVEYEVSINDNTKLCIGLEQDEGGCRVVLHKAVVEPMDGYSASAFDILDPIWID